VQAPQTADLTIGRRPAGHAAVAAGRRRGRRRRPGQKLIDALRAMPDPGAKLDPDMAKQAAASLDVDFKTAGPPSRT